jgi:hypothetical protein
MRGNVLDLAKEVINGERQDQYGNPEDSFALIAEFWTSYIKRINRDLNKKDVAMMMSLLKHAREVYQAKKDNLVDAAGYIGIAGDIN